MMWRSGRILSSPGIRFGILPPRFLQPPFRSPTAMYKLKPSGRFFSFLLGHHNIYFTVAASEAGFKLVSQRDFVKDGMDYFLIFAAK